MPTYEYKCQKCGHQLEAFQKMSDAPLTDCPACHGQSLQKLVSAAGFQLKGSGWYVTDFRDRGKPAAKSDAANKPADKPIDKPVTPPATGTGDKSGSKES